MVESRSLRLSGILYDVHDVRVSDTDSDTDPGQQSSDYQDSQVPVCEGQRRHSKKGAGE